MSRAKVEDLGFVLRRRAMLGSELAAAVAEFEAADAELRDLVAAASRADLVELSAAAHRVAMAAGRLAGFAGLLAKDTAPRAA